MTAGSQPYKTTPVWTEETLPDAIRTRHSTKAEVWGLLRMLEGKALLVFEDGTGAITVEPERPGLIPPQVPHHVEPVGSVRMQVEFYRERPDN